MKLPFRKNKEFLTALYNILGFYPHNIELYRIAFAHKSLAYHRENNGKDRKKKAKKSYGENATKPLNNERLEYLGDAVLETVVSDILFRHFEYKREGFLTSTRSKIVQRETLNRLAEDMGLDGLIQAAQGTRVDHHTNIGGNAFEALMGAIYLDRGFQFCHWFISNRIIGQYIDLENIAKKEVNFKSKLLEWSQKNRINIKFNDSQHDNKDKDFECAIVIEGITLGRGTGRSKKEAQQAAAKEALTRMRRDAQSYDNIFRAKEKRTAMEAEESFALPKIDEIEETLKSNKRKGNEKKAEVKKQEDEKNSSDAAYDLAYDESAEFEVIDQEEEPEKLTAADYESKGLPLPPEENELKTTETRAEKRRNRNRAPKTVDDAVNGGRKKKNETKAEKPEKVEKTEKAEKTPANKKQAQTDKPAEKTEKNNKAEKPAQGEGKNQPKEKRNKKQGRNNDKTEKPLKLEDDEKDTSALQTQTAKIVYDDEPETQQADNFEAFDIDDFEVITPEMLAALEQEENELHEAADALFERPSEAEIEKLSKAIDEIDWNKQAQTDLEAKKAEPEIHVTEPENVPSQNEEPEAAPLANEADEAHKADEVAEQPEVEPQPEVTEAEPLATEAPAEEKAEKPVEAPTLKTEEPDFIIAKDLHSLEDNGTKPDAEAETEVEIEVNDAVPFAEMTVEEATEAGTPILNILEPEAKTNEPVVLVEEPECVGQAAYETEATETEVTEALVTETEATETEATQAEPVAAEEPALEVLAEQTEDTPAAKEEKEDQKENEVKDNEEVLPKLRHISLDDFLFGMTESVSENVDTPTNDGQGEKKTKKSHHRNHRTADNKKEQQTEHADKQERRPKEHKKQQVQKSVETEAKPANEEQNNAKDKGDNAKSKRRYYRHRPAKKNNNQQ